MASRNFLVEATVDEILRRTDGFMQGEKLASLPTAKARSEVDKQLGHGSNSVRLAVCLGMNVAE